MKVASAQCMGLLSGRAALRLPPTIMLRRTLVRRLAPCATRRWSHTPSFQLNSVTEQDVAHFSKILAPSSVISTLPPVSNASSEVSIFNTDWMNKYHGRSTTVLRPRTTQEVSAIVRHCNARRIGVVPQGGNTGLVGGSVPVTDELVLSLGNMNSIRSFDDASGGCAGVYWIRARGT